MLTESCPSKSCKLGFRERMKLTPTSPTDPEVGIGSESSSKNAMRDTTSDLKNGKIEN